MADRTRQAGRATALVAAAVSLMAGLWAWQAEGVTTPTITLGSAQGLAAATGLAIPLTLANNGAAQSTSLSLDVAYDPTQVVFRSAQAGAAAVQAAKQLASSTPAPGRVHVVIFGLNQTAIADGELARITFDILGTAAMGAAPLTLPALSASNATGQPVVMTGQPGAIQVLGNQAPFVSAGADQTITLPATAPLDGTATDDGLPAGSALTTAWSQVSGPGTVIFGNAGAVDTTAAFSLDGSYVLRLTATDGALSNNDIATVTVNPAPDTTAPAVSLAASPAGPTFITPQTVTVTATATDPGGISQVEFYDGAMLLSTDTTSPYSHVWNVTVAANGTHAFLAKAKDAAGNVGTSAPLGLTAAIPPPDAHPAIQITTPTSAGTFQTTLSTLAVRGTASDDLGIARVAWTVADSAGGQRGAGQAEGTTAWSIASVPLQLGANTIRVAAVDTGGQTTAATLVVTRLPLTQAPAVQITRPADGAVITSLTRVYAEVKSSSSLVRADVYLDGRFINRMTIDSRSGTVTRVRSAIRPRDLGASGTHVLEVRATVSNNQTGVARIRVIKR